MICCFIVYTVKVVVILLVRGIYVSRNLEMFSVIELQVLTMGLSDMGFCVFSLGSICVVLMFWIRVVVGSMFRYTYVGCHVFEVVKSYLCVSVPVLDDDCGAFVRFVYDDSIMDDKLFQGLCFIVC